MIHEERIPRLGVNEDFAKLVEWYIEDGQFVKEEDPLALIETSKATFEITASNSGYVRILVPVGKKTPIQQVICILADSLEEINGFEELEISQSISDEVKATNKAIELATKLGVDIGKIAKDGLIREHDVQGFYEGSIDVPKVEAEQQETEVQSTPRSGRVDPQLMRLIEQDRNFGDLSSELKVQIYKAMGAKIGDGVIIKQGAKIVADYLFIDESAIIGENTFIKGEEVKIGRMVAVGGNCSFVTRRIRIGDVCSIGEKVLIGGGGAWGEEAGIEIGARSLISSECIVNTGHLVTIGEGVALSPRVQIYTHHHWQNILEGYNATFGPVAIGDKSYITGNCLIVPGVSIGKGCTALANSLIIDDIEDYTMVVGVPAKPVSKHKAELSLEAKDRLVKHLMKDLTALIESRGYAQDSVNYFLNYDDERDGVFPVVLCFEKEADSKQQSDSVIFDLTQYKVIGEENALSDEVRNFLRRRGIRFHPIHWRYEADAGFYNT